MYENLLVALQPFATPYGESILARLFVIALAMNFLWNHGRESVRPVREAAKKRRQESAEPLEMNGYETVGAFAKYDFVGYKKYYEAKHGKLGMFGTMLLWLGFEESDKTDDEQ